MTFDDQINPFSQGTEGRNEIDIAQIFLTLWNRKGRILASALVVALLGLLYAIFATPVYYSEAAFALKDVGKGSNASSLFSQFGVGGAVAAQFSTGNTNLNKIEVVLRGHELADSVITANNLLPLLYPKLWDPERGSWKSANPKKIPTLNAGARLLREKLLFVNVDQKKSIIHIGIRTYDSTLAKQMVDDYLVALNNRIRGDIVLDADQNREFLEQQLGQTTDPTLREKISDLIADEIEKVMFVSSQSLDILEKPAVPMERESPKKKVIVILSFLLGLALACLGIFARRGLERLKAFLAQNNARPSKQTG